MFLSSLIEKIRDYQDTRDIADCIASEAIMEKEMGSLSFSRWELSYNSDNIKKAKKIGKILSKKFKKHKIEVFTGVTVVHGYCSLYDPSLMCVAIQLEW